MIVGHGSGDKMDAILLFVVANDHPGPVVVVSKPVLGPVSMRHLLPRDCPKCRTPALETWILSCVPTRH